MCYLEKYNEALEYFKKAEKCIIEELKINPNNLKINQLAGITYNNLACYYKTYNFLHEAIINQK